MTLANKLLGLHEAINKKDLALVRTEVVSSFSDKEMKSYKTFKDFFAEVDVQNGYEEEWKPKKWKPYYKVIWGEYEAGNLKVEG